MGHVLLTNAQQRKTLAAARSLSAGGIGVITAENTRFNPAAYSKYCGKSLVNPDPGKDPGAFLDWLIGVIPEYKVDVLFPMDDDTMEIVMNHREELEQLCRLPLPPVESYAVASDKGKSTMLAVEQGVDCPETIMPESLDDVINLAPQLKYPVIVKPRKSSGSRGIRKAHGVGELISAYKEIDLLYPSPIIQEYISPGDRYDVCLLYDGQHRLKASFVQKELRHFPLEMGPSTVQESVYCPELVEKSAALLDKLNWCGIVELEYMVDKKDGLFKFMEINPRFWNSLHLAVLAGVDFPWLLYHLALGEDIDDIHTYKTGIKCRWLLPGDILHFIYNKDRLNMNPRFFAGKKQGIYDDILSFEDPMPLLGFILACLRYLPDKDMWKFLFKR